MKKILAIQHESYETLGGFLPVLKQNAIHITPANFYQNNGPRHLAGFDGLIIMGGPQSANDAPGDKALQNELKLIDQALTSRKPLLGICLGAQLIAKALGATVKKNPVKEIGWYPIHLTEAASKQLPFSSWQPNETVFHWHGETFEIPKGAQHLASSAYCENQAFSYSDNVLALQFHVEITEVDLKEWCCVENNLIEISSLDEKSQVTSLLKGWPVHGPRLTDLNRQVIEHFMAKMNAETSF